MNFKPTSKNKKTYASTSESANESKTRFDRLDALRGVAIVWMTIFHFCFDLNYFGYMNQNFYEDGFWTWQRTCIVSLFLFCAGCGQAAAVTNGLTWPRFWKRWRMVAGAAALVTIGSYFIYPNSFIYFGILHGIALMLILLRLTSGWSKILWILGLLVIGLKQLAPSAHTAMPGLDVMNGAWLNWIGFINRKPITEDYVPLVPWLGVLWLGYSIGLWIIQNKRHWFSGELKSNFKFLAVLGQWSLSYYLIHQPVLFGLVMLAKKITG